MSSGGSAGDAGSTSQEATAPEDYTNDYGYGTADEGYADVSTTSTTTDSGSSGFEGSPEMGGSRVDTTAPDTSYDAGGQDPGVPSPYKDIGTKPGDYINPNDTGSNLINNVRAEFATLPMSKRATSAASVLINPLNAINPLTTIGRVNVSALYDTVKFNKAMGRPATQGILGTDGLVTTGTDNKTLGQTLQEAGDSENISQSTSIRTVDTAGTGLPEPSSFLFNEVGSKNYVQEMYRDVAKSLYTPRSQQGLLAVEDSPYYDFLKASNLNRRVI